MLKRKLMDIGFDRIGEILTDEIPFEPSLMDLCKMNSCGNYGKSYTCPPLVGEPDDLIRKAQSFKKAVVFQKVYRIADSFDVEGMGNAKNNFSQLIDKVNVFCKEHFEHVLVLGAGGCGICETCGAVTNEPCRFPQKAIASLESYCIQVSALAALCNMNYINGKNTVTYFGAVLL